jgi:hypothetical protein
MKAKHLSGAGMKDTVMEQLFPLSFGDQLIKWNCRSTGLCRFIKWFNLQIVVCQQQALERGLYPQTVAGRESHNMLFQR